MLRQPPVLSTVSIGRFVTVLLVDLVECGVKFVISMPESCNADFIHLARVSLEAGLYGFDVINKQVVLPLSDLVTSMYCKQFHRTKIYIFIDSKFYFFHMELNVSSF